MNTERLSFFFFNYQTQTLTDTNKKGHSTLSNSFWASSDIADKGQGLVLFIHIKYCTLLMLLVDDLFFNKAHQSFVND